MDLIDWIDWMLESFTSPFDLSVFGSEPDPVTPPKP
jgi:hypothetical protein